MTTLGNPIVYRSRGNKYAIYLSVSGDLSHSYQLIPTSSIHDGTMGVGYAFNTKEDAMRGLRMALKVGYGTPAFKKWYNQRSEHPDYNFSYLSEKEAKPYLRYAYGDYADSLRKKHHITKDPLA